MKLVFSSNKSGFLAASSVLFAAFCACQQNCPAAAPLAKPKASGVAKQVPEKKATASPAQGQGIPLWRNLLRKAQFFYLSEKNDQALAACADAISSAEKLPDKKALLDCLSWFANYQFKISQMEELNQVSNRALELTANSWGKASPEYAKQLAIRSFYFTCRGEVQEARKLQEEALSTLKSDEKSYPLEISWCRLAEGRRLSSEGSFGLADDAYQKALSLKQSVLKENDPELLVLMKEYAELLDKLDRKADAQKFKEKINYALATEVFDQGTGSVLSDRSGQSGAAGGKGVVFKKLADEALIEERKGNKEKAMSLWKLAVQEGEKTTGLESEEAFALVHLADVYLQADRDQALSMYKKSLALREKVGKENTLGQARALLRLAQIAQAKGENQEYQSLLSKAYQIEKNCQASDSVLATCLQSLLSAYIVTKKHSEAEIAAKELLAISQRQKSPLAPLNRRMALSMLGSIYMQTGRMNEGLKLMQEVAEGMKLDGAQDQAQIYSKEYAAIEKEIDKSEYAN